MRAIRMVPAALAGAGLITLALSVGVVLAASTVTIKEKDERYSFNPETITVALGDTVTWKNDSDAPHTVDADDGSFEHDSFDEGESVSETFDTAGTFAYHCDIHSYMHGTVKVLAAGLTAPPTDTVPIGSTGSAPNSWLLLVAVAGLGMIGFAVVLARRGRDA